MATASTAPVDAPAVAPISVVVCCYAQRRWESLVAALHSVDAQPRVPAERILVVDHNRTLLERASVAFPGWRVVPSAGPPGLSAARNTGWRLAQADVVAFLDDDAVAGSDWCQRLVDATRDPLVLATGGVVAPRWEHRRPRWWPEEFDWVVGCTYRGLPEQPARVRNVIGASMAFRREVLVATGGFAQELGRVRQGTTGCEETELCIRAVAISPVGHVLFDPSIRVDHLVPRDRATIGYFLRRCAGEGASKARVSRIAGATRGLATERRYVTRTLPRAVATGLADAVRRGDPWGAARAAVVLAGLGTTGVAFAAVLLRNRVR